MAISAAVLQQLMHPRQLNIPSPLEAVSSGLALKNQMQGVQMNQLQLQGAQQQQAELQRKQQLELQIEKAITDSADANGKIDWAKASNAVMPYDRNVGMALSEQAQKIATAEQQAATSKANEAKIGVDTSAAQFDLEQKRKAVADQEALYTQYLTDNNLPRNAKNERLFKTSLLPALKGTAGEMFLPPTTGQAEPFQVPFAPKTETAPRTVTTDQGVMQWNPQTNKYDIKVGNRPPTASSSTSTSAEDVKDTARGIAEGQISPQISQSVSFRDRTAVSAELQRLGYNQAEAERDWRAINKHLSTLNGAQQERLRQAIVFTNDTLPQLEAAYAEWKKQAGVSGFKVLNKANLATMKQLPGVAGSAATNLDALIADFTSELGTVYKGGNSSTDESLKLAAQNLSGNWNETTFNDAVKRLRTSLNIRKNSIATSEAQGVSPASPYQPGAGSPKSDPLNIR